MSAAPTDCRVPDPTDAKADGGFGNHRAGYSPDRLAQAEYWARKGGTLAAGEGLVLCAEIDRLRKELVDVERDKTIYRLSAQAFAKDKIRAAVAAAEQEVANDAG